MSDEHAENMKKIREVLELDCPNFLPEMKLAYVISWMSHPGFMETGNIDARLMCLRRQSAAP